MKRIILFIFILLSLVPQVQAAEQARGMIFIPALHLYEPIVFVPLINHDYDLTKLHYVANLGGTNWVEDGWGNVVLAGHTPGAFSSLVEIQPGDEIILFAYQTIVTYEVSQILVVDVSHVELLAPTPVPSLTLLTCYGDLRLVIISTIRQRID